MNLQTFDVIAVFDFDGTITSKDTLFDFIRFYHGTPRLIAGIGILSPILVLFKLGFITNSKAKQILFSYFFGGKKESDFNAVCERYASRINEITVPEAIAKIRRHQQDGHAVIIASASVYNWIAPWAKSMNINAVIATRIEVKDGIITGKFHGANCHGQEKVERLMELYPDRDNYQLYAYGDSNGDKQLLEIADYPFYRRFF
ncbi:MAG: HAD-IB family hydrolase [Prevotella sp.]|jgi:HAD superfamily hydrolase (TIGR01490 family)|nr:HAD-IB family hydrolase [Prevotella sp.]